MSSDSTFGDELREALGWIVFALCMAFLPNHLRHWFKLPPLLAAVAGPWIGMVLALAIDPPTTRTRKWLFVVGTAVGILVYLAGLIFKFP